MTDGCPFIAPKPVPRPDRVSLREYLRLFGQDFLSAQPSRLYRARMAEFRTPFFRSFLVNQPDLVRLVLSEQPGDFPKSDRIREGLAPLLGNGVFLANGPEWERQRRIVNPAFEGGRLRLTFPAMRAAALAARDRLAARAGTGPFDIEPEASHAAADVIFRTLFSIPIEHEIAAEVFAEFRNFQRGQPLVNLAAVLPLPRWLPRGHSRAARQAAARIRALIRRLTVARLAEIAAGTAPDDLATKIMTTPDALTGQCFTVEEMVDQVAVFFLAGHETSASAMGWALWLLAASPQVQAGVRAEARAVLGSGAPEFGAVSRLSLTRDVFRETLRLYPPVPMMVRAAARPTVFRGRRVARGDQVVVSPWHLQRHERLWDNPDAFDPGRWQTENGRECQRTAYIPFSAGARVCTGAGFAMVEGVLLLATILRDLELRPVPGRTPVPFAQLTVRGRDGIWLEVLAS